jgi:adenylate kinase family enzyme
VAIVGVKIAKRILITGNAGSGKSTFGKKLAKELNLPLYGLDNIVWKKGWLKTPEDEKQRLIKGITDKECWIIEGVSKLVFEEADKVYFLDIPAYRCVINIVKRFLENGFGTREEMPDGCPEFIGVWKAIRIVFIYGKVTRPWLLRESTNSKVVRLTTLKEVDRLLGSDAR